MPGKAKGGKRGATSSSAEAGAVGAEKGKLGGGPRVDAMASLPEAERKFVAECVSVAVPALDPTSYPTTKEKAAETAAIGEAVEALEKYHMCILDNALTPADLATIQDDFDSMLDFTGDSAIGEKQASKRSATRM
jgi:hypothetical protein